MAEPKEKTTPAKKKAVVGEVKDEDALFHIQQKLNAPKNQYNGHGNFKYRSLEDILGALKPLLEPFKAIVKMEDSLESIADKIFIKAEVTLVTGSGREWSTSAYALHAMEQKGMNPAQISGSTSSYARKYATNALFAIDDTKDDDFLNKQGGQVTTPKVSTPPQKGYAEDDERPWLREEQKDAMLASIRGGHAGVVKEKMSGYKMSRVYREEIDRELALNIQAGVV